MNNFVTFLTSLLSSLGITAGAAWWLGRQWVNHKLNIELKRHEAQWGQELEKKKAVWQGEVRKEVEAELAVWQGEVRKQVETELGERAAEREYELAAKQRLYTAIGPLRFQLLTACRDAAEHITAHGSAARPYSLEPTNYYGKSTLYRIIRPLTISELIERQIAFADFAVDPSAIDLLRFKKAAFETFKGCEPILNHPNADWDNQVEHIFHHSLTSVANTLIVEGAGMPARAMMFHEFENFLADVSNHPRLEPFVSILRDFTIDGKPIFWTRLVLYSFICSKLVNKLGANLAIESSVINPTKLLAVCPDKFITDHSHNLNTAFEAIWKAGL